MQKVYDITAPGTYEKKTAVAVGYFDGVHLGHQKVICTTCKELTSGLAPAVFTFQQDRLGGRGKGEIQNILTQKDKEALLEEMGVELLVCPPFSQFMDYSPARFVKKILVDKMNAGAVCCGSDYRFGKGAEGDTEVLTKLCGEYGIAVHIIPPLLWCDSPVSSTRIRAAIEAGDMIAAAELLGRPYSLRLPVVQGRRLGRTIGIPTINQMLPPHLVLPRFGVYRSTVEVGGERFSAITNVGVKPTVKGKGVSAETHIFDWSGDLYGRTVEVQLLDFIRDERRFDSVEVLKEQIEADIKTAKMKK